MNEYIVYERMHKCIELVKGNIVRQARPTIVLKIVSYMAAMSYAQ